YDRPIALAREEERGEETARPAADDDGRRAERLAPVRDAADALAVLAGRRLVGRELRLARAERLVDGARVEDAGLRGDAVVDVPLAARVERAPDDAGLGDGVARGAEERRDPLAERALVVLDLEPEVVEDDLASLRGHGRDRKLSGMICTTT